MKENTKISQRNSTPLKDMLPDEVRKWGRIASTLYLQRIKGFVVPSAPHFDNESTAYFVERLRAARSYLEYGAGGSSFMASQMGKNFISVDSDSYFLRAVKIKIEKECPRSNAQMGHFIHADIGLTEAWGVPVFTKLTPSRLAAWKHYFSAPWLGQFNNFSPDLILVDGRFRVACALTSIFHLTGKKDWEVLVDDYVEREQYRVIEQFAVLEKMVGRMAIFKPMKDLNVEALQNKLLEHETDWW